MSTSTVKYIPQTYFTNDRSIDATKSITLNYKDAMITNIDKSGYVCNGNYESNSQGPQLIYKDGKNTYNCNADKVYFANNIHSINGVVMDGELIIHHTASSSSGAAYNDIYTVFPLHSSNNPKNQLDEIMSVASVMNKLVTLSVAGLNEMNPHTTSKPLSLNNLIEDGLFIEYESVFKGRNSRSPPDSIVLLSTTPIQVDTIPSISFDASDYIVYQNPNYKLVNATVSKTEGFVGEMAKIFINDKMYGTVTEGFQEGLETADVNNMLSNMECELIPYDMSGNQDVVKTYLVESTFFDEQNTNNSIVMMKYFLFFVFFMVIIYVVIPFFYIVFAIRSIPTGVNALMERLKLVSGMEVFFQFLLSLIIFIFLMLAQIYPDSKNVRTYNMIGFFTLVFLLVSYLLIEIQKVTTNLLRPIIGDNPYNTSNVPSLSEKIAAAFMFVPNFMKNLSNDVEHAAEMSR
jgi:membrane-bound inhibitor of C-type lysozyme